MIQAQPQKLIREEYDRAAHARELEFLHKRINDLAINPPAANLKTDHAAADLSTQAHVAAALNATNAAINQLLAKINLGK